MTATSATAARRGRPRLFSDEQLTAWMGEALAAHGGKLTMAKLDSMGFAAKGHVFVSRFGSWTNAKKVNGPTPATPAAAATKVEKAAPKLTLVANLSAPAKRVKTKADHRSAAEKRVENQIKAKGLHRAYADAMSSANRMGWMECQVWSRMMLRAA